VKDGQRGRVDAEKQVEHGRVADRDRFISAAGCHAGLLIQVGEDAVHRRHHRGLQLEHRLGAVHPVADARDDVGAERRLAVEGRKDARGHARPQVHQRADEGRGADVKRDAEAFAGRVSRFECDQLIACQHGRHLEAGVAQGSWNRSQHGHAGDHVVALRGQRFSQAQHVAALVFERRLGQLEEDFSHVGVEDDQPAEAHRCSLRNPQ